MPPTNYEIANAQQSKNPVVVVKIAGINDVFSSAPVFTIVEYGDPAIVYGMPGLVYGGLRPFSVLIEDGSIGTFRNLISLEASSFSVSQTLEPEQGKASVSQLSIAFIDLNGYMSQVVAPGIVIPEILGVDVEVFLGFDQISFPQDFIPIFRGVVTAVNAGSGIITLGLSDPSVKKRTTIFFCAQTETTAPVLIGDTTITVTSNADFFEQTVAPDGSFWPFTGLPVAFTYIQIDSEWIECFPISTNQFSVIQRGARGTTADAHDSGATVNAGIQIGATTDPATLDPSGPSQMGVPSNPVNAMDLALMVMLSGWGKPFITGIALQSIGDQPDANPGVTFTDHVILADGIDAVASFGLTPGDWIIMEGSAFPVNNNSYFQITRFADLDGQTNRIIYVSNDTLNKEQNTPATIGFRSQYDILPLGAGLALTPSEVDVVQHQYIKNTFLVGTGNALQFFFSAPESSAKNWMEAQVYLPVGAYSLTRRGLLSVGYTSPPIAAGQIAYLTPENILDPKSIAPQRATNNRAFFNEIDISINPDDAGDFLQIVNILDDDSFESIGINTVLPLPCNGVLNLPDTLLAIDKRGQFLLSRYGKGATILGLKVNWQVGSTIEAGDVVIVQDDGSVLQITNFNTGERALGTQLFEVIGRTLDIKSGIVTLKLVNGLGAQSTDRFAVIAPSSLLASSPTSTTTELYIEDSFGAVFPGNESAKWVDSIGLTIAVHSPDYTVNGTCTLLSIDSANNYLLHTTPLGFTPLPGYVVEIDQYPTSLDPTVNETYKLFFAFLDPTVDVVTGVSATNFTVSGPDASLFLPGAVIRVHSVDYSIDSGEVFVLSVVGTTVTTKTTMGFTPASGQQVDLIGFADSGFPYRFL